MKILNKMKIIKKEKIVKISINEMKIFQFSGIQDKAFLFKKFYNSIENFVKNKLKITTFFSEDIFSPSGQKLKQILSALINYHKFITDEQNSTKIMKENYMNSEIDLNHHKVLMQKMKLNFDNLK